MSEKIDVDKQYWIPKLEDAERRLSTAKVEIKRLKSVSSINKKAADDNYTRFEKLKKKLETQVEKAANFEMDLFKSKQRADKLEKELARAREALNDIAKGNVPSGFLRGLENWSKEYFQEKMFTWCQDTASQALKAYDEKEGR